MKKDLVQTKKDERSHALVRPRFGANQFSDLHRQMNELFENFYEDSMMPSLGILEKGNMLTPKFEVVETDDSFHVTAELPGIEQKDIEVNLDNNILTVKGEKKEEHEEKKKPYHLSERSYGHFQRSISVPDGIDREKIKAEFKKGILKINLPKTEQAKTKSKKIQVRSD